MGVGGCAGKELHLAIKATSSSTVWKQNDAHVFRAVRAYKVTVSRKTRQVHVHQHKNHSSIRTVVEECCFFGRHHSHN